MPSIKASDPVAIRVRELLGRGENKLAVSQLHSICNDTNENSEHWFLYGVALAEAGDVKSSIDAFKKAVEIAPLNIMALTNLGRAYATQQKHLEAIATLKNAINLSPGHKPALIQLVISNIALQNFKDAEEICTAINDKSPYDVDVLLHLGIIRKHQGEFEQAIAFYDQALAIQVDSIPVLINKGLALQSLGRVDEAIKLFKRAAQKTPTMSQIWHILAMAWMAKSDLKQAITCFEKILELNPSNTESAMQLAKAYRHVGLTKACEETCKKVLNAEPDNAEALFFQNAYSKQENKEVLDRIPAEVTRQMYKGKSDVSSSLGESFNDSLTTNLEYKAPDVLNDAVRDAFDDANKKVDILELGCGSGLCGSRFSDIASTLVGTDISPDMLAGAKEKHTYTELYDADLIDVLERYEATFDLIIAMDVLCFFGDLTGIFKRCHTVLKEQGIFGFSVVKPKSDVVLELQTYGHFVHSLAHLEQVAESTGFKQVFSQELPLRREMNEDQYGYVCLYKRL